MAKQNRKLVGLIEPNGEINRGYFTVHTVNDEGQEVATPLDVELTPEQVAAFNAALASILSA